MGVVEEDVELQERVLVDLTLKNSVKVSRAPIPLAINDSSKNPLLPYYTCTVFFTMQKEHFREFRKTIVKLYMQSNNRMFVVLGNMAASFSIHICSIKL